MNKYHLFFRTLALLTLVMLIYAKMPDISNYEMDSDPYIFASKINYNEVKTELFNSEVNAIIEIPAGTIGKWEVDKSDGKLKWEFKKGKPRKVKYLGYPANYGMIPGTLLSKEKGGDGDPLDVIILGPAIERGKVLRVKIIGVMYLLDGGEKDDKLIAVIKDSHFSQINDISELNNNFTGILDIIELWFTNYKGPGELKSEGFGNKDKAMSVIKSAIVK
ncbi:MAG: inorganic diphosphatase [Candidatus Delongbacteria bacterium]|nr:inorganic diphosphatase [Candidatus Delongbacteria bacterium]